MTEEHKKYKLYLKTHNITGLKYLGKTIRDPLKYDGSGKRWRNHIKIHGNDINTEVIFSSENLDEFNFVASVVSYTLNVSPPEPSSCTMFANSTESTTSRV